MVLQCYTRGCAVRCKLLLTLSLINCTILPNEFTSGLRQFFPACHLWQSRVWNLPVSFWHVLHNPSVLKLIYSISSCVSLSVFQFWRCCSSAHFDFTWVFFFTDRGVVYGCGDNKFGQCGVGNQNPTILNATAVSRLRFHYLLSDVLEVVQPMNWGTNAIEFLSQTFNFKNDRMLKICSQGLGRCESDLSVLCIVTDHQGQTVDRWLTASLDMVVKINILGVLACFQVCSELILWGWM